ncbi:MAG: cation:proton antiporter [Prevotellaceae bacterium]|jgi:Kef-type K+ transport system membrane component KefB/nucleotide-binding universal stress UspA family protein|nr:cation:proton antiporter [Prevotellaceae bacterium]
MANPFLNISLSFPLHDSVLIFSLILFIILFAPLLLNKMRIPHLIGLIIAGVAVGPYGFNIIAKESIQLFGDVGLLYIMFLAGLDIDRSDFKKNGGKSVVFGLYTFLLPMGLGSLAGYYLLQFSWLTAILFASMIASHTLIAYPLISKLGVAKNRAVNIAVGGTVITDTLALMVLAVIAAMAVGELSQFFWLHFGLSILFFGLIVWFAIPALARWFFKHYDDNVTQYTFLLGLMFLASFLAKAAGLEAIIGAFLAGLALNRLIPRTSPLMNRTEFVGNALFIPFFLIGVGMMVDFRMFVSDIDTLIVAGVMTVTAMLAKFIAAWLTQKTFRFSVDERHLIFGLSNAQAAATLATVLVGYNIILGYDAENNPIRMLNENVLNGTIIMILVTCTMASIVAQKGAKNIALSQAENETEEKEDDNEEKTLIPVHHSGHAEELVNLCLTTKSKKNRKGIYALHVVDNTRSGDMNEKEAKKALNRAAETAAAADNELTELLRYDSDIVNAITSVVREQRITNLILGLHESKGITDSFLGKLTEGILANCNITTLIYKPAQPLATIKRHVVVVPGRAEREPGFPFWLVKLWNIGRNTGAKLVFYATGQTLNTLRKIHDRHPVEAEFIEFDDWDDFLIISRDLKTDDNLFIVMSRKNHLSYNRAMGRIPVYLNKYFHIHNFILVFPVQHDENDNTRNLTNPSMMPGIQFHNSEIERTIHKLFKR